MRYVPIAAFKDRVSEMVDAIEAGDEITITRHGRPAAKLVSAIDDEERKRRVRQAANEAELHRERMRINGRTATTQELIAWKNEGRP